MMIFMGKIVQVSGQQNSKGREDSHGTHILNLPVSVDVLLVPQVDHFLTLLLYR